MRQFADVPFVGTLRSLKLDLSFSERELTSRGVESLAAAEFFPSLTHLTLDCSLAKKTTIGPILARGTSLRALSLGRQTITKEEAATRAARNLEEPSE